MTRESRKLGCVSKCFLFLGALLLLTGMGINVFWFLYVGLKLRTVPLQLPQLYVSNLLPSLSLLAATIFISYFARRRWQQFLAFGVSGFCIALSLVWAIGANSGTFVGVLMFSSATEGPTSGNTPQEMFRYAIQDPIPFSVSNLEGVGDTWQGYSIYLRFQASESDISSLIASRYKSTKCSSIADRFILPKGYNRFKPPWNPNVPSNKQCYEANNVKSSWGGSHYLVIDRKSGTVYFHGVGA